METKKIIFAMLGLLGEAEKQIAGFYEELVDRGRLIGENPEDPAGRLVDKALGKRGDPAEITRETLRDAFDNLGLATTADAGSIRDRLAQIEKLVKQLKAAQAETGKDSGKSKAALKKRKRT